ncbi:MAG: hypothetical protein KJ646_00640 [Nanoarchaeota archaeon]|nr:hypothetical protein [Nanoarchaeota archaeon]MBU4117000.1 hypothetical protein [Nanoarchaeota archaeon]
MKKKLLALGIFGGLALLINSYNIKTSEIFRFNNPIPINTSLKKQIKIVSERPHMTDTTHSLDLFNYELPIITLRKVTNPTTKDSFQGILDSEENIHTLEGTYELQSAHDSNWYVKK